MEANELRQRYEEVEREGKKGVTRTESEEWTSLGRQRELEAEAQGYRRDSQQDN